MPSATKSSASRPPKAAKSRSSRPPLQRHEGAERDTRPAWATRGIGIGDALLGEAKGDLVKPGMTQADLDELEKKQLDPDAPDPFGDVFRERRSAPRLPSRWRIAGQAKASGSLPAKAPPAPPPPPQSTVELSSTAEPTVEAFLAAEVTQTGDAPKPIPPWRSKRSRRARAVQAMAGGLAPMTPCVPWIPMPQLLPVPELPPLPPLPPVPPCAPLPPLPEAVPVMTKQRPPGGMCKSLGGKRKLAPKLPPWRLKQPPAPPPTSALMEAHPKVAASTFLGASAKAAALRLRKFGAFGKSSEPLNGLSRTRPKCGIVEPKTQQPTQVPPLANSLGVRVNRVTRPVQGTSIRRLSAVRRELSDQRGAAAPVPKAPVVPEAPSPEALAAAAAKASAQAAAADARRLAVRQQAGAHLAQQYFLNGENTADPPAKRQKTEGTGVAPIAEAPPKPSERPFAADLLAAAPASIQTCRSLLLFLDKKLEAAVPEAPAVVGPAELQPKLQAHAEAQGRLLGLRSGGWDARAKRILDISSVVSASAPGKAAIDAAAKRLDEEAAELSASLQKEEGAAADALESAVKDRREWARSKMRREWLSWCARLVRAREASLLAETTDEKGGRTAGAPKVEGGLFLDGVVILDALLGG